MSQHVRRIGMMAIVTVTMLVVLPGVAAAPGDLDPSFGIGGSVTSDFGRRSDAFAVAIQADGKIVAAGRAVVGSSYDFALARYNADGTLDATFGSGGQVITDFGSTYDYAYAVAIQADGKIVAAGSTYVRRTFDFALARYNADGTLDGSFGGAGQVITDFNRRSDSAYALAIQGDGQIVAAGYSYGVGSSYDFALARYNADGTLDHSFGSGGQVITDFGSTYDYAYALALQADGKIVAAGSTVVGSSYDFALARYNADGTLDGSFGIGGHVTTDFGGSTDSARGVAIQADGKVVAAGSTVVGSSYDFALARYNADGTLDHSFGSGGQVITDFSSIDFAYALALQADGKIVVAGSTYVGATNNFALARYNADGMLDITFGIGGRVTSDFGGGSSAHALAIQGDGKVIAAGSALVGTTIDFALARYTGTPTPAPYNGTPRAIPGLIQAEDYDEGGQAAGYNDITPGNIGEQYRTDDVDVKTSADEGGGYAVGWFAAGEWLSYTVDVQQAGTYTIEVRVGSALPERTFRIEVGGRDVTGSINVPQLDDWDKYETVRVSGVALSSGRQRVRVVMGEQDYMDINWLNFVPNSSESTARSTAMTHLVR